MQIADIFGITISNGEAHFGPSSRMTYIDVFGNKCPIVWSPAPTGTDTGNVEMLVEERIRIDRALAAAGVTLKVTPHGVTWVRA